MTLTLLAILMIPYSLKLVIDPKGSDKFFSALKSDSKIQYAMTFPMFLLALFIFAVTGLHFTLEWASLLAWIGLLIFLKGILMLSPSLVARTYKLVNEKTLPMWGFFSLIVALLLVIVDTKVIV